MPTTIDLQRLRSPLLVTKSDKPKHRFTWEEKLTLLDPTADVEKTKGRLQAFQSLFAFRYTNGIITKAGEGPRSWRALRGRLTLGHIVTHLLAGAIATRSPRWVGARSLSTSRFVCIDVDADRTREESLADAYDVEAMDEETRHYILARQPAHAPKPSLEQRRHHVEQALRLMGVNPRNRNEVLVQRTPSGGLHYYLFFAEPYLITQLHDLLRYVGLTHKPGHIEFFPSTRQGLRLPFGHIPGRPDRPHAWIDFIDRYRSGRIKRHSLAELFQNIENNWAPDNNATPTADTERSHPPRPHRNRVMGVPKAAQHRRPQTDVSEPSIQSIRDAEQLMAEGIRQKGTRNQILNQLAAHLIWFKHYSADQATEILTTWAMDPRHESVDIARDLANGTGHVAKQIKCMCGWYESKKPTTETAIGTSKSAMAFSTREVETIRDSLKALPDTQRRQQAEFLLHFLWFAKQHGDRSKDGRSWEASPAVRPVMRRWPGCHHMHYKLRIERAIAAGILEITKEKWHRPNSVGRARTYRLHIAPEPPENDVLSYPTALERLTTTVSLDAQGKENRQNITDGKHNNTGEPDASNEPTNADLASNQETGRANATTLHPTRSRIGVGPRPHQRHQKPHATSVVPRANHGAIGTISTRCKQPQSETEGWYATFAAAERHRLKRGRTAVNSFLNKRPKISDSRPPPDIKGYLQVE